MRVLERKAGGEALAVRSVVDRALVAGGPGAELAAVIVGDADCHAFDQRLGVGQAG